MDSALTLCRQYDMIPAGSHVLCAISGGADSVCLLHWLNRLRTQLPFTLTAAHYNHNLRGEESERDEQFVRSFVRACCPAIHLANREVLPAVELVVGSGDVAGEAARRKTGVEETARNMRYDFLQRSAKALGADIIATAHNADDNVETVLMHLIRGCGLRGLTGIPPRRDNIVRPLLTTSRREIEAYLNRYGLPHMEDSTNADDRFTRNRVRHALLPVLEQLQPQFARHVWETTRLLREDDQCLNTLAQQALDGAVQQPGSIRVPAMVIAQLPDALAARAVRMLIARLTGKDSDCAAVHLHLVIDLCRGDNPSAVLHLPQRLIARRIYDLLELTVDSGRQTLDPALLPLPGTVCTPLGTLTARRETYAGQMPAADSFWLACDNLTVRARRTGDQLKRPGRSTGTLKKLMIDEKVPLHLRDLLPVLDCGGQVAAVVGLGQDVTFLPSPGNPCWHITVQTEKGSF